MSISIDFPIPFEEPCPEGYTVYTKSLCIFCDKIKKLLTSNKIEYKTVLCDSYLEDSTTKIEFLAFIKERTGKEYKTFPMVFFKGIFVGGFTDVEKILLKTDAFSDLENGIRF